MPDSAPLLKETGEPKELHETPPRRRAAGARHARLRRGVRALRRTGLPPRRRRPGAPSRRRPRPLDHPARDGRDPRLQPACAAHPRVPARQVRRLHGLRGRLSRHGDHRPRRPGAGGRAGIETWAAAQPDPATATTTATAHFAPTTKYGDVPARQGHERGAFGIFVDPVHCKGCARMRRGLCGARPRRAGHDRQGP